MNNNTVNGKHLDGQAAVPSDFAFRLDNVLFPVHSAMICRLSVTISEYYKMTVENNIDGSNNIIDIPVLTTPVTQESVELILKMLYAPHSVETNVPMNYDVFGGALEFARWLYIQEVYQFIIRYWDADICSKREEFIMTWGIVKLVSAITTYEECFPRSMKDLEHYIGASASHTSFDDRVRLHKETSISAKFWKDVLFSWMLPVTPRQECKRLSESMGDILKIANLVSSSLKDKLNDITTTISSDDDAFQPSRLHPGMEAWYSQAADALDTMFHEFKTSAIMETVPREYRIDILFVQFDASLCRDGELPSNFDFETVGRQCSVDGSFFKLRRMMSSHAFTDNLDAAFVVIVRDSHDSKLTVCLQQRQGGKYFPGYFFFCVCKFECDWGCFDYTNFLVQDPMATLRQYLFPSKSGERFDTNFWGAYIDDRLWPDGPSSTIPLAGHIQLWNKSNRLIPIFAWRMAVTEFLPLPSQDDDGSDAGRRRNFFGTFGTLEGMEREEVNARTVERARLMKVVYLYADQHIFNLS
jgi:hypothetical protein